jgi:hypothetical protein
VVARRFDAALPDLQTVKLPLQVAEASPAAALTVEVELEHSWIGDLVLTLLPPAGSGLAKVVQQPGRRLGQKLAPALGCAQRTRAGCRGGQELQRQLDTGSPRHCCAGQRRLAQLGPHDSLRTSSGARRCTCCAAQVACQVGAQGRPQSDQAVARGTGPCCYRSGTSSR